MKEMPYVWTESRIGADGTQYVTVVITPPTVTTDTELFYGGRLLHFDLDHKKQTTVVHETTFRRGWPFVVHDNVKKWKDEILSVGEMLKFANDYYPV